MRVDNFSVSAKLTDIKHCSAQASLITPDQQSIITVEDTHTYDIERKHMSAVQRYDRQIIPIMSFISHTGGDKSMDESMGLFQLTGSRRRNGAPHKIIKSILTGVGS